MSFKENLLKKIKINQLARKVLATIGTAESGLRIDKDAMRSLLEMSPYQYQRDRDLDLYIQKLDGELNRILVLDSELPIYETTVEDVLIRKSPYTKEMLSIKNVIKILKDSDVKLSRKEASLESVKKECTEALDLTWKPADIEALAKEGVDALENSYADGVVESLALFAELLDYRPPPKVFRIRHHEIFGAVSTKQTEEMLFGPAVVFSLIDNSLVMLEEEISSFDKGRIKYFQQVAQGKEEASVEGQDVFAYLKGKVLQQRE
ncbi:MAG: hypothetical protein PVI13_01540 [Desulfobacterales bacterium]|jgi:hypothetical protein